ncbi:MAG: ABC transporter permease subunit [Clostridiales bacterium]|jgi:NitT/TauT family transport system permease protein|nr:ABC transporter permease subunit [Clostridiales bacterium]
MPSITPDKKKYVKILIKVLAVVFWIAVWQIAASIINMEIFLVSPFSVLKTLCALIITGGFWKTLWVSFYHIVSGFLVAAAAGALLAAASYRSRVVRELLSPVMSFFKAVPVASFIVLLLIVLAGSARNSLALICAGIMVLPVIYTNVLQGFFSTDRNLLEMARVFKVSRGKRLLYIYVSNILPFFRSGCKLALGLCWKAGVAAELIGLLAGTIGNEMYYSKLYLQMDALFAWTIAIIAISIAFEKLFLLGVRLIQKKIER